ncbi:hypothetical protein AYJ54_32185 [Bradyrhizobium centrolobii]|uniref:Uncharacterized protein n=1 Tax=Bradyrhizobium centrolobii TaxID=1505087 RepID=A0A176Y8D0_9BRAD|nr:hypothetical protein AYJ54_32185 [Bradyrhizobium centrolobii]
MSRTGSAVLHVEVADAHRLIPAARSLGLVKPISPEEMSRRAQGDGSRRQLGDVTVGSVYVRRKLSAALSTDLIRIKRDLAKLLSFTPGIA